MSPDELAGLNALLDTALTLPPDARAAWVEELGGEYGSLKTVLRELLAREDLRETGSFLATLPKFADAHDPVETFNAGDAVGPYQLERQIGTGGMGAVWLAGRPDGLLKRHVALKLPHTNDSSSGLAERMARERDILARLEHPHIARLYDAGVAADGRPFLALEYVEGQPIDRYCAEHSSDLRARLELVLQICRAVAYAHAHLVVHRDLKPSNILVDREGQVHLLDFGIAKLLSGDSAIDAGATRVGGIALTPEYASPEQIRDAAVTTASDIYSLGVVVYELLAGVRPYSRANPRDALALAQAVLSIEPPRPSEVATSKGMRRALRGDLDTILIKALKKSPQERYSTVAELTDDIERFQRGEPIRARPDSNWYRARKYVGRHRLAVASAAAVAAALIIGLGVSLWQAREARLQARIAAAEESFLESIFRQNSNDQADPAKARTTTAAELLQIGAKTVDQSLRDAPEARLRALTTLAQMQNNLEQFDEAAALNRKRVELARSLYGPNDGRVVDALTDLATVLVASQFISERQAVLEEGLAILNRVGDTTSRRRANLIGELAQFYSDRDLPKSLGYAEESVRILRAFPPDHDLVEALIQQGWTLDELKRYPEGEAVLADAVAVSKRTAGESNAGLPRLYYYLANAQAPQQKIEAAEANLRNGWLLSKRLRGEGDYATLMLESVLGQLLASTGRIEEGLQLLKHAVAVVVQTRGTADPLYVPMIQEIYGRALNAVGRPEDARAAMDAVVVTWQRFRPDSTYLMEALENQADALIDLADFSGAARALDASAIIRKRTGDRTTNLNGDVVARVNLLLAQHRADDAALALKALYLPPDTPADSSAALGAELLQAEVALARNNAQDSRRLSEGAYQRIAANPHRSFLGLLSARAALDLGNALRRLGAADDAERYLREAVDRAQDAFDSARSPRLGAAKVALAQDLLDLNRRDEASHLAKEAASLYATHPKLGPQYTAPLRALEARINSLQ